MDDEFILALETSCDETAAALVSCRGHLVASEVSSQIMLHRPYGGVVPEVASRSHMVKMRPLIEEMMRRANVRWAQVQAVAATAGPGLASSLLVGTTVAKALAVALAKPFLAINHLEGHLLSPFVGHVGEIPPNVALVVSGGHTLLIDMPAVGDYQLLGRTKDDAAGEAFDKIAKWLGLPYPGGPEIDKLAAQGDPAAFDFPRSMRHSGDYQFSFSGLKTSVLYATEKMPDRGASRLADLCASVQAAIVDVLVEKSVRAAQEKGRRHLSVSGGVSCNRGLRAQMTQAAEKAGLTLHLCRPDLSTDNAAMVGYVAAKKLAAGLVSSIDEDIDPNLAVSGWSHA